MWVADAEDAKLYAYALADARRDPDKDIDTLGAAGNTAPHGLWSDGQTMWVVDTEDARLYAYALANARRDPDNDRNIYNPAPLGLWSNGAGEKMWVTDAEDTYIHYLTFGAHGSGSSVFVADGNTAPTGLWSNGETLWVADAEDAKLYAYAYRFIPPFGRTRVHTRDFARDPSRDIDTLGAAGNTAPTGLWSDGQTMWVVDAEDAAVYAYPLPPRTPNPRLHLLAYSLGSCSFSHSGAGSICSIDLEAAGATAEIMNVGHWSKRIEFRSIPEQFDAQVSIESEHAHTRRSGPDVRLGVGRNLISVTVTTFDGTTKTYQVLINRAPARLLPETLTPSNVQDFLTRHAIATVEEFIAALPSAHKQNFISVLESASPAAAHTSATHPRIVSWGADGRFILAWNTNPAVPHFEQVEFLQPVPAEGRWTAGVIDFSGSAPTLTTPAACATCHGSLNKPLWGKEPWEGTEEPIQGGSDPAFLRSLAASTHPRLATLDFGRRFRAGDSLLTFRLEGNWAFGKELTLRHATVLFQTLRERADYPALAEALLCTSGRRDRQRQLVSLFEPQFYNPSKMLSGTSLQDVQGDTFYVFVEDDYHAGAIGLSEVLIFLLVHDLFQDPAVAAQMSAEAEVVERVARLYHDFFVLKGRAALRARRQWMLPDVRQRYDVSVLNVVGGQLQNRICSALREE